MYFLSILGHLITECRVYVLVKYSMKNRGLTYVIKSCTKERSSLVTRKPDSPYLDKVGPQGNGPPRTLSKDLNVLRPLTPG